MEELIRSVTLARGGQFPITDLCEQSGISRKTGYKHLERYTATGLAGFTAGQRTGGPDAGKGEGGRCER